jgi:hypothetical protein
MTGHPPWLRFQAYVVGLPKTGSTSLATIFGRYRSGHEWDLMDLVETGLARQRGDLTDDGFWRATGRRLDPPSLEMDSTTSHYLYADLLAERYPRAVFVHSVRDVGGWASSVLDMVLRKRLARRRLEIPYSRWESQYLAQMTEGRYDLDPASVENDSASLAPLVRYWAAHMARMPRVLPADRTVVVRTKDIPQRLDDLAALVGVPVETLRDDLAHANRAPLTFDRFALFADDEVEQAYRENCATTMADLFPAEHEAWSASRPSASTTDWDEYVAALDEWVADAIERHGQGVAH